MTMQDLYKGFKKVAEDDLKATLRHENGHELNIAKSGLSKKQKVQLEKLPLHQAQGTEEIQDPTERLQTQVDLEDKKLQQLQSEMQAAKEAGEPLVPQYSEAPAYQLKRQIEGEQPVGPIDYLVPNLTLTKPGEESLSGNEILKRRLEEQQARELDKQLQLQKPVLTQPELLKEEYEKQTTEGLAKQPAPSEAQLKQAAAPSAPTGMPREIIAPAKALTAEAVKVMAPDEVISSPYTSVMQKINAHNQMFMDSVKRKAAADEEFQRSMRNNTIDVNRVYHDMSTGRKIRTIIGMLLGGMAGGILRTENPLQKMLNEEIERDVNAQKQDKSDKMNLYKMHYERLGDEGMAHQQAANNLRQAALMEMEYAMGKLGPESQMGRLAIQSAANQLRLQNQQAISGIAALEQRKKIQGLINSGKTQNIDPSELVNFLVTDDGSKAKVLEEIRDAQNLSANANKILNLFDKAAEERGVGGHLKNFPGVWRRSEYANSLEQLLDPFFKDIAGQNREATKQATFKRIIPEFMDKEGDIPIKRKALIDWMRATQSAPVSKSYGLPLEKFSSTTWTDPTIEKENQFIDYAKRNLGNPDPIVQKRVNFIKNKYGLK